LQRKLQPLQAISGNIHRESLSHQALTNETRYLLIVFDHQYPYGLSSLQASRGRFSGTGRKFDWACVALHG
jgi:hypothetical protein